MNVLLHQSLKDVRQLRRLLEVWLAVLALRALLFAYPFDVLLGGVATGERVHAEQPALLYSHLLFAFACIGLTIVLALQLVQSDSPSRQDAFWITRPVSRRTMWGSKLLTAVALFVALPVVADLAVLAANHLAGGVLLPAIFQGMVEQLALVLPVMTLAAVTLDVGGFALSALGLLGGGLLALILALATFGPKTRVLEPVVMPALMVVIVAGVLVPAVQFVTRSRRLAVELIVLSVVLFALAVRLSPAGVVRVANAPAVEREAVRPFSLAPGSETAVAGRRVTVLSSGCADDICEVVLREVRPVFSLERFPAFAVEYGLLDPASGRLTRPPLTDVVDQLRDLPTGPHVAITWRWLKFDAQAAALDPDTLAARALVPIIVARATAGGSR